MGILASAPSGERRRAQSGERALSERPCRRHAARARHRLVSRIWRARCQSATEKRALRPPAGRATPAPSKDDAGPKTQTPAGQKRPPRSSTQLAPATRQATQAELALALALWFVRAVVVAVALQEGGSARCRPRLSRARVHASRAARSRSVTLPILSRPLPLCRRRRALQSPRPLGLRHACEFPFARRSPMARILRRWATAGAVADVHRRPFTRAMPPQVRAEQRQAAPPARARSFAAPGAG